MKKAPNITGTLVLQIDKAQIELALSRMQLKTIGKILGITVHSKDPTFIDTEIHFYSDITIEQFYEMQGNPLSLTTKNND